MTPAYQDALTELYLGSAAEVLRALPAESVHLCVTSPPYWGGIRSYRGLGAEQLGHEATPEEYVERIVDIMREVRRVLRDDGVLWLNLGDVYTGGGRGPGGSAKQESNTGSETARLEWNEIGDSQLVGIPFRVVLALQADGWRWRDTVIWHKLAPMPESVSGWAWEQCRVKVKAQGADMTMKHRAEGRRNPVESLNPELVAEWADCPGCPTCAPNEGLVLRRGQGRTTKAHEYLFMLAEGDKYYFDNIAIAEPPTASTLARASLAESRAQGEDQPRRDGTVQADGYKRSSEARISVDRFADGRDHLVAVPSAWGRNKRSVWSLPPEPQGDAMCAGCRTYYGTRPKGKCPKCGGVDWISHYAAFLSALVEPCVLAGTSARGCCPKCGAPWARVVETKPMVINRTDWGERAGNRTASSGTMVEPAESTTLGWRATCRCDAGEPIPCTVLDCFAGSGTTSIVARRLGRRSVGIELAPDYLELSGHRLRSEQPGMALGV